MASRYDTCTFFGVPALRDASNEGVIGALFGVASSLGTPNSGAENGPYFVRRLSKYYKSRFASESEADMVDLRNPSTSLAGFVDAGDIFPDDGLSGLSVEIERFIAGLPNGAIPIAIGGDHSITYPLVRALNRRGEGVTKAVIFDHHLDVQCWGEGLDDLYHTNVVSYVARELGPDSVIHIGVDPLQDVETSRRDKLLSDLEEMGAQIPLFSSDNFSEDSILRAVGHGESVYLSFDVDVLQCAEMKTTSYPSWVGLTFAELVRIFEIISRQNTIVGCDIVELAAERSVRDKRTFADAGRVAALAMHVIMGIARQRTAADGTFSMNQSS